MTQEEYRAEQEERARLIDEINRLRHQINRAYQEQAELEAELKSLIHNIGILTSNAAIMRKEAHQELGIMRQKVQTVEVSTEQLFQLLDELASSYFTFKNLSEASKKVTQYTDEYYTRFYYYNELRRISLGYIVAVDSQIVSNENMRKKVEEAYLKNTDYWLAYAITSIMLWSNHEKEAAGRALSRALTMDAEKCALFYLLVYLRYGRLETAKKWYLYYLDRVNIDNLGREWKYLLQAYLAGVFGGDMQFNRQVYHFFVDSLQQMETLHPNYGPAVADKMARYAKAYPHITDEEFDNLRVHCPDYPRMKELLSCGEKNQVLADMIREVLEGDKTIQGNVIQRIEDILYDLINSYDDEEWKVIRKKKENEMIIRAKGDLSKAREFYEMEYPEDDGRDSLDELLFDWAFEEEDTQVDVAVRKFSIVYLKKWIINGLEKYARAYEEQEKRRYPMTIEGWSRDCEENDLPEATEDLKQYFEKNRLSNLFRDKYFLIFLLMTLGGLVALGISIFHFNVYVLVAAVLCAALGGFLLWRRIVDLEKILKQRCAAGCETLRQTLEEMHQWRQLYHQADSRKTEWMDVLSTVS